MADPTYFENPRIINHPIYQLLLASTDGKTIIAAFRNDGTLSKITRCLLSRLVIAAEKDRQFADVFRREGVTYLREFKITTQQFTTWATQIADLFRGECQRVYYTPFRSENGVKINPTGLLYEHFHYTKKRLRQKKVLEEKQRQNNPDEAVVPDDAIAAKDWLNENTTPEDRVKLCWVKSRPARLELLKNDCSIHDYYENFPCLKIQLGIELLLTDFNHSYPNLQNALFDRWDLIRNQLLEELLKNKSVTGGNRELLGNAQNLLQHNKDTIILYMLPALITNPAPKRQRNQRVAKISLREKQDSFILHVETADEILLAIERHREILRRANLTLQPLPVIVGPLENIESIYIYVNDSLEHPTIYIVDSVLQAIDVTLKIFFSLNCAYPVRSSCVWMFIQKAFYDIFRPNDKFSRETQVLLGKVSNWLATNDENQAPVNI